MFINFIKEVLFPLFCVNCDAEGTLLCEDCVGLVKTGAELSCPVCHTVNATGACCETCRDKSYLSQVYSAFSYSDPIISKLIHALKYEYVEEAADYLQRLMEPCIRLQAGTLANCDAIVSVPLHKRRFAERGFNQAESISKMLSGLIGRPVIQPISRKKYTRQQMLLSREEREKNVSDVFVCEQLTQNSTLLLVDDVYTTGATMQACAKGIKEANPSSLVYGFAAARG